MDQARFLRKVQSGAGDRGGQQRPTQELPRYKSDPESTQEAHAKLGDGWTRSINQSGLAW
jgi:hypothetical protein